MHCDPTVNRMKDTSLQSLTCRLLIVFLVSACQNAGQSADSPTTYIVHAVVKGLVHPPADSLRSSNGLVLSLSTSRGDQTLAIAGRDGDYVFADSYSEPVALDLKVMEQPDEYFCQRTDAIAAVTADTTYLSVSCDYLGPQFYLLQWYGDQLLLRGGSLDLRYETMSAETYGLWNLLTVSEDAYVQLVMSRQSPGPEPGNTHQSGDLILTLPSKPTTSTRMELLGHGFAAGTEVPADQAILSYQTSEGETIYAVGEATVTGYGLAVSSRWLSQGAVALEFTVDATIETDNGIGRLTGGLLLSASSDATVAVGSFDFEDGTNCVYDPGQTVAIDPRGRTCHDPVANGTYYRPIYTVAKQCIEQVADTGSLSFRCVRTVDARCTAQREYPLCE